MADSSSIKLWWFLSYIWRP